jgi:hypothetical protein
MPQSQLESSYEFMHQHSRNGSGNIKKIFFSEACEKKYPDGRTNISMKSIINFWIHILKCSFS